MPSNLVDSGNTRGPRGTVPESPEYERIERLISSEDSPVGIDAKKTHVMILMKLEEIERRLSVLEQRIGA